METKKIQIALFFSAKNDEPHKIFSSLYNSFSLIYDAPPIMLPSDGAPEDFPFIQLKDKDDRYFCNISKTRMDFIYQMKNDEKFNEEKQTKLLKLVLEQKDIVMEKQAISRIGLVSENVEIENNCINRIYNKYLSNDKLKDAFELSLRYNIQNKFNSFVINNITEIGCFNNINDKDRSVFITQDINNLFIYSVSLVKTIFLKS